MKKSTFINADMLEPFVCDETYSSKMLMGEDLVCEPAINMNIGTLQPYTRLPGSHHEKAEVYYVVGCEPGAEVVTGTGKDGDEEIHYRVKAGDVIHIPGGVHHWIDNRQCGGVFTIMTIWPQQEQNGLYFARKKAWGESFRFKKDAKAPV